MPTRHPNKSFNFEGFLMKNSKACCCSLPHGRAFSTQTRRDVLFSRGKKHSLSFPPSLPISPVSFKHCLLLLLCLLVIPHYSDKSKLFFSLLLRSIVLFVFVLFFLPIFRSLSSFLFSFFLFLFLFCCSTISHSLSHCLSFSLCSLSLSSFLSQCHKSLISRRRLLLLFFSF